MQKKDQNIDKFLRGKLPEPDVPADDAWGQMDGLLNAVPAGLAAKGLLQKLLHFKWALISGVAATAVSTVAILQLNQVEKPTQKFNSKQASENGNTSPITRIDSIKRLDSIKSYQEVFVNPSHAEKTRDSMDTYAARTKNATQKQHAFNRPRQSVHSRNNTLPVFSQRKKENLTDNWPNASKTANQSLPVLTTSTIPAANPAFALKPLNARRQLKNAYKIPKLADVTAPKTKPTVAKAKPPRTSGFQIGLDWNLNSSLQNSDYIFAGKDSISKPALLLIPGIFVSKSWQKHLLTFTASPNQTYFGNNEMISHEVDSLFSTDSLKSYNNLRFQKARGLNFSIYYHYQIQKMLAIGAGASYSIFSNALIRREFENYRGQYLPMDLETFKKDNLSKNINPRLFALKAGILFNPGRFQTGLHVILPISDISKSKNLPLKSINAQLFLRFSILKTNY